LIVSVLHRKFDRAAVLWAFGGLAGALVILVGLSSVLLIIGKADPLQTFRALYRGAFGSRVGFGETLIRFAPVTLIALGLVPSLRIGLFNIGAPGQIGMGALCASLISFSLAGFSSPFVLAAAFVAGCAGGAVWAVMPGALRAWLRVNEILSTLVFNFLAVLVLQYLLTGPPRALGRGRSGSNTAESCGIPASAFWGEPQPSAAGWG
jgi:simple sugar transport system permease protein